MRGAGAVPAAGCPQSQLWYRWGWAEECEQRGNPRKKTLKYMFIDLINLPLISFPLLQQLIIWWRGGWNKMIFTVPSKANRLMTLKDSMVPAAAARRMLSFCRRRMLWGGAGGEPCAEKRGQDVAPGYPYLIPAQLFATPCPGAGRVRAHP